ncbi:MAG: choice-of-anchor Q domain-containing protein [Verrucomicrobiota bacterium]
MRLPILAPIIAAISLLPANARILTFGDTGTERVLDIAHDSAGNIFVCGDFEGTVDFDPSDGADAADTFTANAADGFIASYESDGTFRFALHLADSGGFAVALRIAVDTSGNLYAAGITFGTVDFDRGSGVANRVGDNDGDGFVASYSNTGAFRFANVLGGSGFTLCSAINVGTGGDVVVTGVISSSVDVDPTATSLIFNAGGPQDGYVAGFNSSGVFQFGRQLSGNVSCWSVAVDATGNAFVCGFFESTADFDASDPADAGDSRTSAGFQDIFLASYSPSGSLRWVHALGGSNTDRCSDVTLDSSGNCFITGSGNNVDFDPGPGTVLRLPLTSTFVASYTGTGAFRFVVSEDDTGSAEGNSIDYHNGNIFVAGNFRGTIDLGPGDSQGAGLLATAGSGSQEGFVASYAATDGSFHYAKAFGNNSTTVSSVVGAPDGSVVLGGEFEGTADFDPGFGTVEETSSGVSDAFLLTLDSSGVFPGATTGSLEVTNTNDSGAGSLRQAIDVANSTLARDRITFAIPGAGPHIITPATPLPDIAASVEIDGFSQSGSSNATWPPQLKVIIDGTSAGIDENGLSIGNTASNDQFRFNTTITGLVLRNFNGFGITLGGGARQTDITNCFVGVDIDGVSAVPNADGGISVRSNALVSGEKTTNIGLPGKGNLISGNGGAGVLLNSARGVAVKANYIGTTAAGNVGLPNSLDGVLVIGSSFTTPSSTDNVIGGTQPMEGNRIAFNTGDGVALGATARTDVMGNSISDNGGLGIDHFSFSTNGPLTGSISLNDIADGDDELPNNETNFPLLRSALNANGSTHIAGELDGTAGETFRVELFSSSSADLSGHGEGEAFLGAIIVRASDGPTKFSAEFPAVTLGHVISATSTSLRTLVNSREGTSEFSKAIPVLSPNVTTLADTGAGSLRAAITAANGAPGPGTITISPELTGQTINLGSPLPTITNSLNLQGTKGVTLSGDGSRRVLSINAPGEIITVSDLIIADGFSAQNGGGILLSTGDLNLERCIIHNCHSSASGGGIAISAGDADLIDSRITLCSASVDGGGIAKLGGQVSTDRVTIDGCSAGARGGAVFADGTVFLKNTTLSKNTASTGAGVLYTATSGGLIEFCTIVHNAASTASGGISGTSPLVVRNIIALNTAPLDPDIANIINYENDNLIGGDPLLGPLRNNGGWIPTHALRDESPARNQATGVSIGSSDARLAPRRNLSTSVADYGAFEYFTGPFGETPRNYADWRFQSGAGGRDADDNNDGIKNLNARIFGIPVTGPSRPTDWELRNSAAGNAVIFSFSIPFYALVSQVESEVGSDLSTWSSGPNPVEVGSTTARRFYEVTIPVGTGPDFVRAAVTE